jgi:hypothetical protein
VFSKNPKEVLALTVNLGSSFVRDSNGVCGYLGDRAVYLFAVLTCIKVGRPGVTATSTESSVLSHKYHGFRCDENGSPARREEGAYLD